MNSPPTEDFKVNFQVRLPVSLRQKITTRAHDENKSLNAVVVEALEESFDDEPA
jgi:predicted HicB family RNase H-like nuclease